MGTQKNRKASGKMISRATWRPNMAGTLSTIIVTRASWVAAFTATRSPSNHSRAAPAIGIRTQGSGTGRMRASNARRRQISQALIGGTRKAWAKVSERAQVATMNHTVWW